MKKTVLRRVASENVPLDNRGLAWIPIRLNDLKADGRYPRFFPSTGENCYRSMVDI